MTLPIVPGLAPLAGKYDGFILDVWGVLHQGGPIYPEALDCLRRLRAAGRRVVLLSNAPVRAAKVEALLFRKGLEVGLHHAIVSSGEAARHALDTRVKDGRPGRTFRLLGPVGSHDLLDGLGYIPVGTVEEADFLLGIGLDDGCETVEAHEPVLRAAAAQDIPMICVNPDRLVIRLGTPELCAGALAARYEALGGSVRYFGKPFAGVYDMALAALAVAPERVLAVGDGPETDVKGAHAAGLACLLVTDGLLADVLDLAPGAAPDPHAVEEICREAGALPTALAPRFSW